MKSHHLRLPDDLMTKVDERRGLIPRNAWIRNLLERELSGVEIEAAAGIREGAPGPTQTQPRAYDPPRRHVPKPRPKKQAPPPQTYGSALSSAWKGCAEHPTAGATESRGRFWCSEPGCSRPAQHQ